MNIQTGILNDKPPVNEWRNIRDAGHSDTDYEASLNGVRTKMIWIICCDLHSHQFSSTVAQWLALSPHIQKVWGFYVLSVYARCSGFPTIKTLILLSEYLTEARTEVCRQEPYGVLRITLTTLYCIWWLYGIHTVLSVLQYYLISCYFTFKWADYHGRR